jgi:protein-tyrosine-phosphatase
LGDTDGTRKRFLFVCIENSSRSVMAEAFAKSMGLEATSAGTFPATHVNELVVEAMKEVGIDVSGSRPKELSAAMVDRADVVVLTDASLERALPNDLRKRIRKKVLEWHVSDPQGRQIEEIRHTRDEIEGLVRALEKGPRG